MEQVTGLKTSDERKLLKDFWDNVNNRKKVSVNLLSDDDVEVYEKDDVHLFTSFCQEKNIFRFHFNQKL